MQMTSSSAFENTLSELAGRLERYRTTSISTDISAHDDMLDRSQINALEHYDRVGRGAIDIVCSALALAGRSTVTRFLDLPCGGGRVTRHLVALFPEAAAFVSDIDPRKVEFCRRTFSCTAIQAGDDFDMLPHSEKFDLIFCGSLLTHLPEQSFKAAINFFAASLEADGLAIITLHGRASIFIQNYSHKYISDTRFNKIEEGFRAHGFGYADYERAKGYGISVSAPSWVCGVIEKRDDLRLLGYAERFWDNHQDVLILQKRSVLA